MNTTTAERPAYRPESSPRKTENAHVIGRSPGNRAHNLIATNTVISIGSRLAASKAEIYVNGMRVALKANTTCYPDVAIVAGKPSFADANENVLRNPTGVVEIFSNATDPTDKMRKVESYLAIESVKECLLIKADEMRVEHYSRQNAKQWLYRIYDQRDDVVSLESVDCKLPLAAIYSQIDVKPGELNSKAIN